MTSPAPTITCSLCDRVGPVTMDPPRRTLARVPELGDPSYAVIAVLPDMALCEEHAEEYVQEHLVIGWCDKKECRRFGECGQESPCGEPYKALGPL